MSLAIRSDRVAGSSQSGTGAVSSATIRRFRVKYVTQSRDLLVLIPARTICPANLFGGTSRRSGRPSIEETGGSDEYELGG